MSSVNTGECVDHLAVRVQQIHHGIAAHRSQYLLSVTKIDHDLRHRAHHFPRRDRLTGEKLLKFRIFEQRRAEGSRIGAGHFLIQSAKHAQQQDRLVGPLCLSHGIRERCLPAYAIDVRFLRASGA